jgi:hypothetical protein
MPGQPARLFPPTDHPLTIPRTRRLDMFAFNGPRRFRPAYLGVRASPAEMTGQGSESWMSVFLRSLIYL